jgi:hypothetical protein
MEAARDFATRYNLSFVGTEAKWAVTSLDDKYRYLLGRMWDTTKLLWVWNMMNPSTARVNDDPTIRKCCGFTTRGGGGGIIVINALPYSSSSPDDVATKAASGVDVEHYDLNVAACEFVLGREHGKCVAAWGKMPKAMKSRAYRMQRWFCTHAKNIECLGKNEDGSPRHPLIFAYATPFVPYDSALRVA